ncbi:MAG: hypothetical protein B0D92_05530 [Spirochaeta sp. LUC14_002_19_P3]|nr:MAG: hypothetical protein B0D92_05530 [Spirochaeta sp. LUC14_002_19_P3]
MPPQNFRPLLDVIDTYTSFCILGHMDPDMDCLGSQRALASWLKRRGKTVVLCSFGPWRREDVSSWKEFFLSSIPDFPPGEEVLTVLLDCSSPERTGFKESDFPKGATAVIDHHATSGVFGDFRFIDANCPSTTMLIQHLMEAAGDVPTQEEAQLLFFGFCTDTGFFRHLDSGKAQYLKAAARLMELGVSPTDTHCMLFGGRSLGSRRLIGRALERAELHYEGRVLLTWENWKDWRECGSERDSDMLYQLLISIAGVEAVAVIREQNDGLCIVNMRSVTDLDVSAIAEFFGGGGHRKAAGCTISGDRHDASEHLLRIFADRLNTHS